MKILSSTKDERERIQSYAHAIRERCGGEPLANERLAADVETLLCALGDLYAIAIDHYAPWTAERDAEYKAAFETAQSLLKEQGETK